MGSRESSFIHGDTIGAGSFLSVCLHLRVISQRECVSRHCAGVCRHGPDMGNYSQAGCGIEGNYV
jgi:hypothetical protein